MITLGASAGRHARDYCGECETRIGDVYYRPRHLRGPVGTVVVAALRALAGKRR